MAKVTYTKPYRSVDQLIEPFAVQFPARQIPNAAMMTDAELDAEVSKGFDDITAGRKRPLEDVAAN